MGGSVPERGPRSLPGMVRVPPGLYRYDRLSRRASANAPSLPVPYPRTFEKLAFRDSFQPEGHTSHCKASRGQGPTIWPPIATQIRMPVMQGRGTGLCGTVT
ncbi:MAG: hypothetical protein IT210_06665 [Armatimonadetes bacterium]|nr:hypothetical protein [Armatimonadota bacterium]